jgi:hypothetical protein
VPSCVIALIALVSARVGEASAPAGHFTAGSTTVVDTQTRLTWQTSVPPTLLKWPNADAYCQSLSLGGMASGWRLPSVGELLTLVDDSRWNPATDPAVFPNTPMDAYYWTSSAVPNEPDYGWTVDFRFGLTTMAYTAAQSYSQNSQADAGPNSQILANVQTLRVRCVHSS